jgi:hypothetical protein
MRDAVGMAQSTLDRHARLACCCRQSESSRSAAPKGQAHPVLCRLADNREQAAAVVSEAVEPSAYVEVTDGKLLPANAEALGLRPGEPKAM